MKKILKLVLFYALVLLFAPILVFARGRHRQPAPPPIVNTPPPVSSTTLQFGFFLPPAGVTSAYTMEFTDGAFPAASGNLVIFWEAPYTDSQIVAGQSDSLLKSFATASATHPGTVVLALGEEVNCDNSDPWGGAYPGNTVASTIAAFQHEATLVRSLDPNIKIAFSTNNDSCYGQPSPSAYYPGSAYVDIFGVDGFDFGGQTWDQVFDHALATAQGVGKPVWILSEGAVNMDNQAKFVSDGVAGAKTYGIPVELYFNYAQFAAPASTLEAL